MILSNNFIILINLNNIIANKYLNLSSTKSFNFIDYKLRS